MEFLKKNKSLLAIISMILVIAVAAVCICLKIDQKNDTPQNSASSKNESVDKNKDGSSSSDSTDDKIYITDCDSTDGLEDKQNLQVISDEGLYVQGKGAFINSQTLSVFCAGKLKNSVDISKMKGGNLHISFYIGSKENFKNDVCFELSSSGTFDQQELQWSINLSKIKEGWNEKYLPMTDAVQTGSIDLTRVNYFRFYSPDLSTEKSLDVILDDVYVTNQAGEDSAGSATADGTVKQDSYKETGTAKGKRIMSCNTVNILSSLKNAAVTTAPGEFVEGSGAMKLVNANYAEFYFKDPIDISAYDNENGKLHVSFYINDASLLTGLTYFYLSSASNIDEETIYWYLQNYQIKSGWNDLELPFYTSAFKRNPNFSAINYLKVHLMGVDEGSVVILDDIYVTDK